MPAPAGAGTPTSARTIAIPRASSRPDQAARDARNGRGPVVSTRAWRTAASTRDCSSARHAPPSEDQRHGDTASADCSNHERPATSSAKPTGVRAPAPSRRPTEAAAPVSRLVGRPKREPGRRTGMASALADRRFEWTTPALVVPSSAGRRHSRDVDCHGKLAGVPSSCLLSRRPPPRRARRAEPSDQPPRWTRPKLLRTRWRRESPGVILR
jgi:hypothetical protein